ncbi:MAG: penicillin-binding protein, partial [Enterococcus sp.]
NALQTATANIDTLAKQKANELTAAKLNTPMVEEASTFSNQLISERINTLSQFELIVTDTQDNWQTFDQYAQQVYALVQQVEPSGGTLSDQYTNVYRNKEVEYAREKDARDSALNSMEDQIDDTKNQSKDLDKRINDLKKQLQEKEKEEDED